MKITDKRNQHYVPKFYLRYFSFENNNSQIGVYSKFNKVFVPRAKLKTQASKKYFYGKDGSIEDWLSEIESLVAPIFLSIKKYQKLPKVMSTDQVDFLFFLILLDMRNPNRKTQFQDSTRLLKERILSHNPDNKNSDLIRAIEASEMSDNSHLRNILNARRIISICMDLNYKLIKNTTNIPFISSDNPLIKYNQFLELRKWEFGSHNGYGVVGAQMFIPLSDEYLLIFYDSNIYKVGNKKETTVIFDDEKSIHQLNRLQYLNSTQNIFFNHKTSKEYVDFIVESSRKYQHVNKPYSEIFKPEIQDETKGKEEIIFIGITDLKTNLSLQKVKMHSKSKRMKLDDKIVQLRPRVKEVREYEKNKNYIKNVNN